MRQLGAMDVPQLAFLAVLELVVKGIIQTSPPLSPNPQTEHVHR